MAHVYDELVTGPDDFIGALAYSLYKQSKVEWIVKLKAGNGGIDPTPAESAMFHSINILPANLQGFKDRALVLASSFLTVATHQRLDELSADTVQSALAAKFDSTQQAVSTDLASLRTELQLKRGVQGWLSEVGAALITNFLTIFLVALVAYAWGKFNSVNSNFETRVNQALSPTPAQPSGATQEISPATSN
jgi:hypothetical protein